MIRNYFAIAWRNLKTDSFYGLLNIIGLGLGMAVCLLIIQYLRGEWYVDKHHDNYEHIYQVNTQFDFGEGIETYAMAPSPLANRLLTDYPEVINATRLLLPPAVNKYLLIKGDLSFFEQKGIYADSTFFEIFKYPFVEGTAKDAIKKPNDIVISETLAAKLFNKEGALGKALTINTLWGDMTCQVTGVVKTDQYRSHLDAELFINMKTGAIGNRFANLDEWAGNNMYATYLQFHPGSNPLDLEKKFPALIESTAGERLRTLGFTKTHSLFPVQDIYLKSRAKFMAGPQGNITFFYIFAVIGFFILLIACINFMNLSTAKSSLRATEVAVKKVLGASRTTLAIQFFLESSLHVFFSILFAIVFIILGQTYLQDQVGLEINNFTWLDWELGLWVFVVLSFTSFLAGSYPALMLSSFSPMSIFHGKLGNSFSAAQVRKVFVVTQFVISIMLIQGILVINEQMKYIQNEDLGYSKTEKIVIPLNTQLASNNAQSLKQEILGLAAISSAGFSSTHPGLRNIEDMLVFGEQKAREENMHVNLNWADADFIPTMGFELLSGRNFREGDSAYAIVTESALAGLGYTLENALDKKVRWNWSETEESRRIIGIIKDYHSASLKDLIQPQVFLLNTEGTQFLIAGLQTKNFATAISELEKKWKSVNTVDPFEFYFLNEKVQQAYEADLRMSALILVFTLLAILISCFGLIGLSAFSADRRKKEIGVRKILGASISSIVQLLSREFVWLVLIALCIATPIAWYLSNMWLSTFSYRIEMPWYAYAWAGLIAVFICMLTVSYQAIKAAKSNPVNSLRAE